MTFKERVRQIQWDKATQALLNNLRAEYDDWVEQNTIDNLNRAYENSSR